MDKGTNVAVRSLLSIFVALVGMASCVPIHFVLAFAFAAPGLANIHRLVLVAWRIGTFPITCFLMIPLTWALVAYGGKSPFCFLLPLIHVVVAFNVFSGGHF